MAAEKKSYIRLFFKILLLAVYFAFFSVQLFLRYASSHSQQSLDLDSYQKHAVAKNDPAKTFITEKDNKKNKCLSYLNKRFHPQDAVTIPGHDLQISAVYTELVTPCYIYKGHVTDVKINAASLRGPPAFS